MDLPYCKICGERHRLGHCPEWDEPPKPKKVIDAPETPRAPQAVQHHQAQEAPPATPEVKPKFDKRAYQRELMRKRRAAAKAHAPAPHNG
jgi:hypothetical protein